VDADQRQSLGATAALDDLVRDAHDGAPHLLAVHDAAGHF
jgi:hypothetical protein